MSYSFSVPAGPAEGLRERAEQAAADCKTSLGPNWVDEADRDVAAAITAAEVLAEALTDGDGDVGVTLTISGHANAGRGYPGTDSVYVSVARAPVEATS